MYDLSFVQNHVSDKHQYLKRRINPKKNSPKTPEVVFRTQETELSQDPLTFFDLNDLERSKWEVQKIIIGGCCL